MLKNQNFTGKATLCVHTHTSTWTCFSKGFKQLCAKIYLTFKKWVFNKNFHDKYIISSAYSKEEAVLQYCLGFFFLIDKFKICCNHELVKCFVSILQYMHTGGKKS